jgi:hypothetical protein
VVETYKSPSGNGIIYDGIMGNLDRPSEDPTKVTSVFKRGLMSPTTSIRPQARPEEPTEETASTRKRDPISELIASMGDYTDDREALANAVAGPSSITTDRDSALAEYEDLPPAPTMGGSMRPVSRGSQTEQVVVVVKLSKPFLQRSLRVKLLIYLTSFLQKKVRTLLVIEARFLMLLLGQITRPLERVSH